MSSSNGKGKGVDWKATAEMLSSTSHTRPPPGDEAASAHPAAKAVEAILTNAPDTLPSPTGREAIKDFDTIKLIYELDEMKVAKATHPRFPTVRSAPPPPYRAIAPKPYPAKGFLDTSYEAVGEDTEMTDFNEVDELAEGWHTMIQRSLRRMRTADAASLRVLGAVPEAGVERWECHECNLAHPVDIDESEWDGHDPNICKCCNHDRCGRCWDLNENGWRVQYCDGNPLG